MFRKIKRQIFGQIRSSQKLLLEQKLLLRSRGVCIDSFLELSIVGINSVLV